MQNQALDQLFRTAKDPRLRTRAQMVLLAAEEGVQGAPDCCYHPRERGDGVALAQSYVAEMLEGLQDAPRPGRPAEITTEYRAKLLAAMRRRPRSLHLRFSLWSLPRLADDLAEHTWLRIVAQAFFDPYNQCTECVASIIRAHAAFLSWLCIVWFAIAILIGRPSHGTLQQKRAD